MKKNNLFLVASCGMLALAACGGPKAKKTPSGIDYTVEKSGSGEQLKIGDTALLHFTTRLNDSVMFASKDQGAGGALAIPITKSADKFDLLDGFAQLKVGDSATFWFLVDSLQQIPRFAKKGDTVRLSVVVDGKYTTAAQPAKEAKEIDAYLGKHNLKQTTKTASGVAVVVTQEGAGETPKAGDTALVNYRGTFLNGKEFDTNMRPGMPSEPMRFPVGQQGVIKGFDEGVAAMKKGSKATIILPSAVAYGFGGNPNIPGNSILVFELELVDIVAPK